MIKNIIILGLLIVIFTGVTSEQALDHVQSTLDFLQQLVYDMKESENYDEK